jgi:hypothetical protein
VLSGGWKLEGFAYSIPGAVGVDVPLHAGGYGNDAGYEVVVGVAVDAIEHRRRDAAHDWVAVGDRLELVFDGTEDLSQRRLDLEE